MITRRMSRVWFKGNRRWFDWCQQWVRCVYHSRTRLVVDFGNSVICSACGHEHCLEETNREAAE